MGFVQRPGPFYLTMSAVSTALALVVPSFTRVAKATRSSAVPIW